MATEGGGDHAALFCDTNVLVRLLTRDIPTQAHAAGRALDAQVRVVLTDVIVAEVCYVLTGAYELSRAEVLDAFAGVLALTSIQVADADLLLDTLNIWSRDDVDFADAYLAALTRSAVGTSVLSFDADFDRIEGVERTDPARY